MGAGALARGKKYIGFGTGDGPKKIKVTVATPPTKQDLLLREPRAGTTKDEKKQLDEAEEPVKRGWQETCWTCSSCGVALMDAWGQNLCKACHRRIDPNWEPHKKQAIKPLVVYGTRSSSQQDLRHSSKQSGPDPDFQVSQRSGSKGSVSAASPSPPMHPDEVRRGSKSSGPVGRTGSKKSALPAEGEEKQGRSGSKKSVATHDSAEKAEKEKTEGRKGSKLQPETKPSRQGSKQSVVQPETSRHGSKASAVQPETGRQGSKQSTLQHSRAGSKATATEVPLVPDNEFGHAKNWKDPSPPPFSDLQLEKGHKPEDKPEIKRQAKAAAKAAEEEATTKKKAARVTSMEMLAAGEIVDDYGHKLQIGDRVIGEGKIGEDMGPGTVVGANESHGHGMVQVQFDHSGQTHPMKAEHMIKLNRG